ncbi:MAG TPA: diguanylate cyclase [bacterium]|nr:diguanylate cyclase [bacterium]
MVATEEPLKILLVEDNPADAKFLKVSLEENMPGQFELVQETYLGEALQTLSQNPFDIVFLDLSLPDASGFETLTRTAVAAPDVPIVVLTGLDNDEMASQALQAGAQDYLVKGQKDRSALLRSMRYAIERHQSQKNLVQQLEKMAFRDPLTGLLNRRGLQKALTDEMAGPKFDGKNFFALLVGIDNFKTILDTLGRQAGDMVLREVAASLGACLPSKAHLGWLWGDEFMALLPDSRAAEAAFLAEKLRSAVSEKAVSWSSKPLRLSVGVGVVLVPETMTTIDELSNHAHFLLEQSKLGEKNKVSLSWDQEAHYRFPKADSSAGAAQSRFYVDPKPIYRISDNRQVGCEFTIRTQFPGFENPEDFFRLCMRANVLSLMDFQALKTCADFSTTLDPDLRFHFNLFPSTLVDIPTGDLLSCLAELGEGRKIFFEINTKRILGDPSYLLEALRNLRKGGVGIVLDEIGMGSNSLESLLVLEPHAIKLARGLVEGIEASPAKVRYLKRFLKMTGALGTEVFVEGVHHLSELEILKELGIPYGQGMAWKRLE